MCKKTLRKTPHPAAFVAVLLVACGGDSTQPTGSGSSASGGSGSPGAGGAKGGTGGQASGASGTAGVPSGGASGSPGDIMSAMACSAWATATCERQEACDQVAWLRNHGSKSACEQREQALCQKALSLPDTHATSGQVFDCSKTLITCGQRCSTSLSPGQLLSGEPCSHSWQCSSRLCAVTLAGGCGVCSGDRPVGAFCKIDSECAEGLGCFKDSCTARAPEGASCLAQPCALELSCVGFSPLRTCKPRAALGEPCDPSGYGAPDCAKGRCVEGECQPFALVQPGKPCSITSPALCTGGFCDGSTCLGWAKEGDSCSSSLTCGPGSVCIVPSEKCVLAPSCAL